MSEQFDYSNYRVYDCSEFAVDSKSLNVEVSIDEDSISMILIESMNFPRKTKKRVRRNLMKIKEMANTLNKHLNK